MGTSKRAVSQGSGNGSSKVRSSENGAEWKVEVKTQFYFATEVRVLGKHLSGKLTGVIRGGEKRARANKLS